jgi:tyrosinase
MISRRKHLGHYSIVVRLRTSGSSIYYKYKSRLNGFHPSRSGCFTPFSILARLWDVIPLLRAAGMFLTCHADLLAIAVSLLLHLTFAYNSYNYGIDKDTILKRQVSSFYADTGIYAGNGPDSSVPLRQEIRQLQKDNLTWTLYILGLDMLQYTDQTEMLSWYQIAGISAFHFQLDIYLPIDFQGIHGRPYQPFDGVGPTDGNANNGYCTHVSILFPTWHRPYLALYEQVLWGLIQRIALLWTQVEERNQYVTAAANFRIPYWDWAAVPPAGESALPDSVGGSPYVSANGPSGVQIIANPLFSYQFKPLNSSQLPDPPVRMIWSATNFYLPCLDF